MEKKVLEAPVSNKNKKELDEEADILTFKKLVDLKPGTMIKGIVHKKDNLADHQEDTIPDHMNVYLSLTGWHSISKTTEQLLTVAPNAFVTEMLSKGAKTYNSSGYQLKLEDLHSNFDILAHTRGARQRGFFKRGLLKKFKLAPKQPVGMSLGETIFYTTTAEVGQVGPYRPDFFSIWALHKILAGSEIQWLRMYFRSSCGVYMYPSHERMMVG